MALFLICMLKLIWRCVLLSNYFTSPFSIPLRCERKVQFPFGRPPTQHASSWQSHSVHPFYAWRHPTPLSHQNAVKMSETQENIWRMFICQQTFFGPNWMPLMWNEYYKCNCKIVSLFFLYQFTKQKFYCTVVSMRLVQ